MSSQRLVEWIESLLFGTPCSLPFSNVPTEVLPLKLKLQAKGVSVSHAMRNGGLVNSQSLIAGDLEKCLSHFEGKQRSNEEQDPTFQTNTVTRFYNHLSVALARRRVKEAKLGSEETSLTTNDQMILDSILRGDNADVTYHYSSPRFWGETARRLLNDHRSVRGLIPMRDDDLPEKYIRNAVRLYDVTIKTLGCRMDPLSMHLLPDRENYVDPIHFASPEALEEFIQVRENHPLSNSVRLLMHRSVDELLKGQTLAILGTHERLDSFLQNVLVVHNHIHQVTGEDEPPRLVDVFQRLLARIQLDYLWQNSNDISLSHSSSIRSGTMSRQSVLFEMTSRITRLEKQNAFLLEHLQKH